MTKEEMKKGPWVAVLNDNDTYTGLTGCWIAMTDQDQVKALDEGAGVEDVSGPHYDMQALLELAIDRGYFGQESRRTPLRFKMRFEATADLCRLLNRCAQDDIAIAKFESDRMDQIAFDADLTLTELKELLETIEDGHVMADTVAEIADFTGERF
jgi:hypothetical protein